MQREDEKLLWVDHVRTVGTIAVIFLHVSASLLYQYGSIANVYWWVGHCIDSVTRFAVPLFLMLSGALLLSKTDSLGDFFKKRVSRIIYPFLFWSLIYILYDLIDKKLNGEQLNATDIFHFIGTQLKNGASGHFWYIYLIVGIYMIIPIISKWVQNSSPKEITYYVAVWLAVLFLNLPIISKYVPYLHLIYFSGFLGYPILGYLLTIRYPKKNLHVISIGLFLLGTMATIFGTYFLTKRHEKFDERLYDYLSLNVIMAATGVFLFLRHTPLRIKKLVPLSRFISKHSYGIYLAHILVVVFLSKVGINFMFVHPIVGIPVTTILCLTITLGLVYLLGKLPFGKYFAG
jgi:surface polysaccharide O-acyltransferase-like enzyme